MSCLFLVNMTQVLETIIWSLKDVTGDRSKVQCCKEQYYIGTWKVRSMNQGKLGVVKQEIARVNIDILEISELKFFADCIEILHLWLQKT